MFCIVKEAAGPKEIESILVFVFIVIINTPPHIHIPSYQNVLMVSESVCVGGGCVCVWLSKLVQIDFWLNVECGLNLQVITLHTLSS